jgi:hypothetical protein
MRAINSAQADYNGLNRAYADALATLVDTCPPDLPVPFLSADLDDGGAGMVTKSGYDITLANSVTPLGVAGPADVCTNATMTGYFATADPETAGTTGNRSFATDTGMAVWQDTSGTTLVQPFAAGGTVSALGR